MQYTTCGKGHLCKDVTGCHIIQAGEKGNCDRTAGASQEIFCGELTLYASAAKVSSLLAL